MKIKSNTWFIFHNLISKPKDLYQIVIQQYHFYLFNYFTNIQSKHNFQTDIFNYSNLLFIKKSIKYTKI